MISDALMSLAKTVTLLRASVGTYDANGRWQEQNYQECIISAAVHPDKQSGGLKLYTLKELFMADNDNLQQADHVIVDGVRYKITDVVRWDVGNFYEITAKEGV